MANSEKKTPRTAAAPGFEHSSELKRVFNDLADRWCKRTRLGLADLAERCGVSLQYLSHVGRYGRVPSKPILTLLAFNLEVPDPAAFFRAAGVREPWPYETGIGLRARPASESGLLSVSLDMNGFASAIREIVRSEIQPKRVEELIGKRALRVGLNRGQFFLFDECSRSEGEGFFPELVRALALSLHCRVEFHDVPHGEFSKRLEDGSIDCFGPVYRTVPRIGQGLFSKPFCRVALAGLGRTRKAASFAELPLPKRLSDLRKREYVVAVHRESMAHHFAETELGVPPHRLLVCDLPEEAVERVVLTSLPRPAHLVLTDSPYAYKAHRGHPTVTELLFASEAAEAPPFEDTLAVRSDWPSLVSVLDQAIDHLRESGALSRLFERTVTEQDARGIVPAA